MASRNQKPKRVGNGEAAQNNVEPTTRIAVEETSDANVYLIPLYAFVAIFVVLLLVIYAPAGRIEAIPLVLAGVVAAVCASGVHVAQQWERVAVLRFGKLSRICGPGIFVTIPLIESCTARIDQRIRVTNLRAKETLTSDLIPVDVDAVMYWMVWGAKEACTEVADFTAAIENAGQVVLRDAIGRSTVAEITLKREQLDAQLQERLDSQANDWGITVLSVSLRDLLVPKDLQDSMSLEAQTDQRCKARIMLAESEREIAEILSEVGKEYKGNDEAMRLRVMHLLYESIRDTGGTVVMPSSFSEGFGDIPIKGEPSEKSDHLS